MSLAWQVRTRSGSETIPQGWTVRRIGDLVTLTNGFPFPSESFGPTGDIPLVRIRDLGDAPFETFVSGRVPASAVVRNGDVIIGMDGDFNLTVWRKGEAALNQRLCMLRPRSGVDMRFIAYSLPASLKIINDLTFSTTVKHLSSAEVLSERIALPPLAEQRRIADFLDAETARIDALTSRRKVQQQLLVERRAALKTECVTYSGPQKVHHPLLGDIHPDWQVLPLRRILPAINVGVVINPSHYFTESGVPFIHGFNVREGFISRVGMKFMSAESNELHRRSRVHAGDVLVVRAGATAGRAAKVGEEFDGANCASVLILRKSETLDAAYLETFLNAVAGKGQVSFSQYGAAQEVISAGQVSSFAIALPSMSEQVERVAEFSAATAETVALESGFMRQVALLSERRQSLITAAVTGQFDVSTASGRNVTDGVTA